MNDPKENLLHIVKLNEYAISTNGAKGLNLDEYFVAEKIRNESRIIAFSIDKEIQKENYKGKINGFQFQRMWASYGQNHEGICLEIDYNKFRNENQKTLENLEIIDEKVLYDNIEFQGIDTPIYGMSPENQLMHKSKCICEFWEDLKNKKEFVRKRFFIKNMDWEGESEYRFLTFNKDPDEIFLSIKESLSKVILGINFSKYFLPSLKKLVPEDIIYKTYYNDLDGSFRITK